jgi:hypothetical protein
MRDLQLQKYLSLPQKGKVIAEYVWIDGSNGLRSKSKVSHFPCPSSLLIILRHLRHFWRQIGFLGWILASGLNNQPGCDLPALRHASWKCRSIWRLHAWLDVLCDLMRRQSRLF